MKRKITTANNKQDCDLLIRIVPIIVKINQWLLKKRKNWIIKNVINRKNKQIYNKIKNKQINKHNLNLVKKEINNIGRIWMNNKSFKLMKISANKIKKE